MVLLLDLLAMTALTISDNRTLEIEMGHSTRLVFSNQATKVPVTILLLAILDYSMIYLHAHHLPKCFPGLPSLASASKLRSTTSWSQ